MTTREQSEDALRTIMQELLAASTVNLLPPRLPGDIDMKQYAEALGQPDKQELVRRQASVKPPSGFAYIQVYDRERRSRVAVLRKCGVSKPVV